MAGCIRRKARSPGALKNTRFDGVESASLDLAPVPEIHLVDRLTNVVVRPTHTTLPRPAPPRLAPGGSGPQQVVINSRVSHPHRLGSSFITDWHSSFLLLAPTGCHGYPAGTQARETPTPRPPVDVGEARVLG